MSIPPSAIPFFERNGYVPQRNLGEGAGGVVVQAFSLQKKKEVAIKVIDRGEEGSSTGPMLAPPSKEVTLLEKAQGHPNIIELYGVEMTEDFVFMIMELAELGSLSEYIEENNELPESTCQSLFRDLITGIKHCHDNQLVHGDVHSPNLLLDKNGTLKLSDFGTARMPEDDQQISDDGKALDIWNAGTVLYNMVYGYAPSDYYMYARLESEMSRGDDLRPGVSDGCKDLIRNIVRGDSDNRLTLTDILEHPWMKE